MVCWIATPVAWAQDTACDSPIVLSCEDARELREAALRGEGYDKQREIAKRQEAAKNKALGQLEEARKQEQRKQLQILKMSRQIAREQQKRKTIAWIGGSSTAVAFVAGGLITFFVFR